MWFGHLPGREGDGLIRDGPGSSKESVSFETKAVISKAVISKAVISKAVICYKLGHYSKPECDPL